MTRYTFSPFGKNSWDAELFMSVISTEPRFIFLEKCLIHTICNEYCLMLISEDKSLTCDNTYYCIENTSYHLILTLNINR